MAKAKKQSRDYVAVFREKRNRAGILRVEVTAANETDKEKIRTYAARLMKQANG